MSIDDARRGHPEPLPPDVDARFRALVEERTGLLVTDRDATTLAIAVAEIARSRGFVSAEDVLGACLASPDEGGAFEELIVALAIRETHFFRNRPHFQALADVVFPELFEHAAARRDLRIWSAGCATGEEVYSLAMTLDHAADRVGVDLSAWSVTLVGTDFDRGVLDHARRAEYGRYSFRGVTPDEIDRFFDPAGDERLRVKARFRDMVALQRLNLKRGTFPDPRTPFHDMDLIVCRNVTIYFSEATTRELAGRFHSTLRDGGYLVVGHAEHSLQTYRAFETRALPDVVLYQRVDRPAPPPAPAPRDPVVPDLSSLARAVATTAGSELRRSLRTAAGNGAVTWSPPRVEVPGAPGGAEAPEAPAEPPAPRSLAEARAALAAGDVNGAVSLALQVLERTPDDADACLLLGELAANRGHQAEADIWLRRTLDLRPLDLTAHYLLALLASQRGDAAGALEHLDRAVYVDADFVMAHCLRARLWRAAGRAQEAERSLRTARQILLKQRATDEVPFSDGLSAAQLLLLLDGPGWGEVKP